MTIASVLTYGKIMKTKISNLEKRDSGGDWPEPPKRGPKHDEILKEAEKYLRERERTDAKH
jgi:hypothetical protein